MVTPKMKRLLENRKGKLEKAGGGSYPYFLIKPGVTRMRLMPAPPEKEFAIEATFFYISKEIGGVVSPATFGEPCAIMELYNKLKNSPRDSDRLLAKEKLAPKKRYFAMHYKYNDEKGKTIDTENGVKLCILTGGQYQDLIDMYLDEESGDMTDKRHGYDIKYKRTGEGKMNTEYTTSRCNPTPTNSKYAGKIYDPEIALRKIIPTYERTKEIAREVFSSEGTPKISKEERLKKKLKHKRDL